MDSFIGMILIPTISSDLKQLFPNAVFFPSLAAVRDSPDKVAAARADPAGELSVCMTL